MKTIVVTGTKGKTTIVHMLDYLLRNLGYDTLRVDSEGSYINGKKDTSFEDSVKIFGKSPNVCPGRYIYGARKSGKIQDEKGIAILEASFSCGKLGTGVKKHDLGIITNIFSDHIDYKNVFSKEDLVRKKSFVLFQLHKDSPLIFNADDPFLLQFVRNNKGRKAEFIPISKDMKKLDRFTKEGFSRECYGLIESDELIIKLKNNEIGIDRSKLPYTFSGRYEPMMQNYLFALLAVFSITQKEIEKKIIEKLLSNYIIPLGYGRYVEFKIGKKKIILDYAHEIEALRKLVGIFKSDRITLVTRLAPDRVDQFINNFAEDLSRLDISRLIIYDKVDGKKMRQYVGRTIVREKGEVSNMIKKKLDEVETKFTYEVILNEQDALQHAIDKAKDQDIVIHIQTDIEEDLKLLKEKFNLKV